MLIYGYLYYLLPRIGNVLGAAILRFPEPKKLVAFVGIDPSVYQSGEFSDTQNKMSKRGSPPLVISGEEVEKGLTIVEESIKDYQNGAIGDEALRFAKGWS